MLKTQQYTSDPRQLVKNLIFIFQEIVTPNNSIPVIVVDADGNPSIYRNIDIDSSKHDEEERIRILKRELKIMEQEYEPITISWTGSNDPSDNQYIYYRNSESDLQIKVLPLYPAFSNCSLCIFRICLFFLFQKSRTKSGLGGSGKRNSSSIRHTFILLNGLAGNHEDR